MQEVSSLLELESQSDEVLMIGIYGATGIGKTTLATEIYNKIENQFQASCFLPNVRESSKINGLVHLQNKLLTELLGEKDNNITNVDIGASLIKNRLHTKKVLLILDDVDKLEQLEALVGKSNWFGPGSRVIITTRDKHLLTFHGVKRIHEVQLLNPEDALKLLSRHIFQQRKFDSSCIQILKELVSYASGLPLALIVIGSYMYSRNVDQWPDVLDMVKKIPPQEIQNKLRTSFDALREDDESICLDIACYYQGHKLVEALNILCTLHGGDVKPHMDVLKDKSFISVSTDDMVLLRPLIMVMGVRQEDQKEPEKQSRLWFRKIVEYWTNALHKYKRIPPNEILETLNMENLRTLIMRKCELSKASKHLLESCLRVLEWWGELPSDFNPNKLLGRRLPNIRHELARLLETSQSSSPVLQTLPIVPLASQASQSVSLASQTSQRDYIALHISPWDLEDFLPITRMQSLPINSNKNRWRIVGLMSSVVGLFCFAFSHSLIRLIRGWNAWKIILYVVFWRVIVFAFFSAEKSSRPADHVWYKIKGFAILMLIAMYAFYYDKAVDGKPEILSLVSNAAFVLMSLSYSKLTKYAHEMGVFSFFLSYLAIQLWMVHWYLIFVAICFGFPLFCLHSSSDPV